MNKCYNKYGDNMEISELKKVYDRYQTRVNDLWRLL